MGCIYWAERTKIIYASENKNDGITCIFRIIRIFNTPKCRKCRKCSGVSYISVITPMHTLHSCTLSKCQSVNNAKGNLSEQHQKKKSDRARMQGMHRINNGENDMVAKRKKHRILYQARYETSVVNSGKAK